MVRTVVLRLYGLLVAAVLAAVATQLLAYSFEQDWTLGRWMGDVASWVRGRPVTGALMLAGSGIVALSLAATWLIVRTPRTRVVTIGKDQAGRATIDRSSLAGSLQRSLRERVHPQVLVETDGRLVAVRAPVRSAVHPLEFVDELAAAMPGELERRGVSGVRFRVTTGRSTKRRVR